MRRERGTSRRIGTVQAGPQNGPARTRKLNLALVSKLCENIRSARTFAFAGFRDTGVIAAVPSTLTAWGTVSITVVTTGGTSNVVTMNLVGTITFNPSQMEFFRQVWAGAEGTGAFLTV